MSRIAKLIFTGDNRGAVKALKGIADQSQETTRAVKGDADEQSASMTKVKESTEGLRESFGTLLGFVGIGGVAFGLRDLKDSAVALQANQAQLQQALKNTGQEAGAAGARLKDMADEASEHGGFGTVENLQSLTAFVRETKSATEAQKLFTLSTEIARGRNLDLSSAQQVVSRAYTGSVGRLQQLIGPMVAAREAQVGLTVSHQREIATLQDQAMMMGKMGSVWLREQEANDHITAQQAALAQMTDKHATAQEVLAAATRAFSGDTAKYSKTTQGQLSNLENNLHNLTEALGMSLLPALDKVVAVFSAFAGVMAKHKTTVLVLVGALTGLGVAYGLVKGAVLTYNAVQEISTAITSASGVAMDLYTVELFNMTAGIEGATIATKAWAVAQAAFDVLMDANPIGLVTVAIVALIAVTVEIVKHWKDVEKAGTAVWKIIKEGAGDAWSFIKEHWELLASILGGPFVAAGIFIATHFKQVENGASDVLKWIEKTFGEVERAITYPFRKAFDFVHHGFEELKHDIGGIGHFLTHPFGLSFSTGGVVPKYLASGGPSGTDQVPAWLTAGEGVLNTRAMSMIGGDSGLQTLNSGNAGAIGGMDANQPINITVNSVLRTNDRQIANAVTRAVLNKAARGPASLVGGSLVSAAPGLPV